MPIIPPQTPVPPVVPEGVPIVAAAPITPPGQLQALAPPKAPEIQSATTQVDPRVNTTLWLLDGIESQITSRSRVRVRHNNLVRPITSYQDYYNELASLIDAMNDAKNNSVYFTGWSFGPDAPVQQSASGSTIGDVLVAASKRQIPLRAIIFAHPDGRNAAVVNWIAQLVSGGALHDGRFLLVGSHHQKLVVLRTASGVVGFCGGMDVGKDRIVRSEGKPSDNSPWHDVHVRIDGPAALDLWQTFSNRWLEQAASVTGKKDIVSPSSTDQNSQEAPSSATKSDNLVDVQIVRTYGNGANKLGLSINQSTSPTTLLTPFRALPRTYSFAPDGEMTIYRVLMKAIRQAKRSIYLEDQYLVASEQIVGNASLGGELMRALDQSSFAAMVILVPGAGTIQPELYQVWLRRTRFWQQLGPAAASKVSVWAYNGAPGSPYWIHSKTWIFDDTFAIVGSANSNRRGYSHDSEIAAAIADPNPNGDRLTFAHELRIQLWLKHLNAKQQYVQRSDIVDFAKGAAFWREGADTLLSRVDLINPTYSPPDRSIFDRPAATSDPAGFRAMLMANAQLISLASGHPRDFEWDNLIDPDGA